MGLGVSRRHPNVPVSAHERRKIADSRLGPGSLVPARHPRRPLFCSASLSFLLEAGTGFTFVERQKHMVIDCKDPHLDLLLCH